MIRFHVLDLRSRTTRFVLEMLKARVPWRCVPWYDIFVPTSTRREILLLKMNRNSQIGTAVLLTSSRGHTSAGTDVALCPALPIPPLN